MASDLLANNARAIALNDESAGAGILQSLLHRSPFTTPVHSNVWITHGLYAHLTKHQAGELRRRLMRASWLEPTLTSPQEVRRNKPEHTGVVYLACFTEFLIHNKSKNEVLAVIVDDREAPGKYSAITMFPLARPRDVEKLRKEVQIWP